MKLSAHTISQGKLYINLVAVIALVGMSFAQAAEPTMTIRNEVLQVTFAAGKFAISELPGGRNIATATLDGVAGPATVENADDPTFGHGQAIVIADPKGGGKVLVFPGLPFVLVKSRVTNSGAAAVVLNKIPVVSVAIDLGKPVGDLKGFGTGGISDLVSNTGSYMWQALVDPLSRNGVVGGWLTTERGSGVVFAGLANNQPSLAARVEYGRLRLAPQQSAELETFALGYFADARLGMEAWAEAVARQLDIKLPPQPTVYCTWYHAKASDEKRLAEQSKFAATTLAPYGFSVVQIDDGWQDGHTTNAPQKNFTRIKPDGPYKSGMKQTADHIRSLGLMPGIWLMPFSGSRDDPWYKDKQDIFAKRDDGTPHDSKWGGTALDMTNPKALEYVRAEIQRIVKEWGYGYLKMDGLCSGAAVNHCYVNDAYKDDQMGDAVLFNPDKTNIQGYRDGLRLIRETAGKETFILGCCAPQNMRSYGGPFGLLDAMRIGPDNSPNWRGICTGPIYGARNYHLHGRIWYNDPDPLYVRAKLPLDQSKAICSWVTISGQLNASSDSFAELPAARIDILKRTMPAHGLLPRPVDLFEANTPAIWLLTDTRTPVRRDVVGLFNWDDQKKLVVDRPLANIGLDGQREYVAFEYWSNKLVGPFKGNLKQTLPPATCAIIALKPVADHPQLISTSRHITQGMVDVIAENWNAEAQELAGISRLVAGDDYELRIVTSTTRGGCKVTSAAVADDDKKAGVTVSVKEENGMSRITIKSAVNREVKWTAKF